MNRYVSLIALMIFIAGPSYAAGISPPDLGTPTPPAGSGVSIAPPSGVEPPTAPGAPAATKPAAPADYTQMSTEQLQPLAEKGDVMAQYYLAEHYGQRNSLNSDYGIASKWYEKAALQGNADAQYKLGLLFQDALGETQNPAKAFFWVYLSAKSGNKQYIAKRDELAKALKPPLVAAIRQKADAWKPVPASATVEPAPGAAPAPAPTPEPPGIPGVTPPDQ